MFILILVNGPDRPPMHPSPTPRRPTLLYSWDLSEHEKWMPPITKLGWTTCGTPISKWPSSKLVSCIDRDKILVSNPMFMWMKNPYDPWLTRNSKWLPSKPAEITLNSQWAQYYCAQCIK